MADASGEHVGGRSSAVASPAPGWARLTAALAVVLSVVTFVHVIVGVSHNLTGPDNALLWYAAPEWMHLRPHEPGFYGQSYGATFNAIPAGFLHGVGVEYPWAVPISLGVSILSAWFALGWSAWRRGHPTAAVLAFAGPALLSSYWVVFVTIVPVERAFALVGIGAAMVLVRSRRVWVTAVGAGILGFGVAIDVSSLVLAVPVGVWFVLDARFREEVVPAVIGVVPAVVYAAYRVWFYRVHPDYAIHGGLPFGPSLDALGKNLDDPYPVFRLFALEIVREWWMPLAAGVVVLVLVLVRRRVATAVPALCVLALILYAMSTPRAADRIGLFLPPARLVLMAPLALWFLVFLVAETGLTLRRWVRPVVAVGAVALAAVSFGERFFAVGTHEPAIVEREALTSMLYGFERADVVESRCARIEPIAERTRAELVVFVPGGSLALACAGRSGNRLQTLDVPFERRTWLLERAARTPIRRLIVHPAVAGLCAVARRRGMACEREAGVAVLRVRAQPALDVLTALGTGVRPFGPGCVIVPNGCSSGTDARRAFPRVTGPATAAERAEIGDAVHSFVRGEVDGLEPMPDAGRTARRVAAQLVHASVRVEGVERTGERSALATVHVEGDAHFAVRAQFVRVDGRWRVARSTACEVAARLDVECTRLFPFRL